ncbi:MAG: short-chain dehydrogenase/reductase [Frankiales bacterium]|nr:short-chain dehydrogenase/reductase [Frankiales bacterium]
MTDPTTSTTPQPGAEQVEHPGLTTDLQVQPDHGEDSYVGSGRLLGKRALVTGGDSGIGRAVAVAFAREGADVAVVHLPDEQSDADETVRLVTAAGRQGVSLPGDLTDEAFARGVVGAAVQELGGLDLLVSNAAYQMTQGGIADFSTAQVDRVFRTNVYAFFWLVQSALPHLQPGSSILVTSSVQAYEPTPALMDYAATKAALVNMTKSLAQELAPRGIRVNTVAPGPIWTPLIPATMPPEQVEDFGSETPLGRAGQPVEVANAFVFLASDAASYITGERLTVAGGMPMP